MFNLLFDILFVAVGSALGAAVGWWFRGSAGLKPQPQAKPRPRPQPKAAPQASASPEAPAESESEEPKFDAVEDMMARLHQLTATVAADVGQHNSRVQEINEELSLAGGTEAGVITVIEKLVQANEAMQSQLRAAEERLQNQAREIESHVREARTDALTKLLNRRAFDDEMDRCEENLKKTGRPTCVLMMDVDHFKKFNDTYGHQAGDEVLRGVSRVLRNNLAGKEVICRYGGEEFAVVFPGSNLEKARPAAERARAAVAEEVFAFEGLDLRVTASAGLAQLLPGETGNGLVKRADDALYFSKDAGRNCGHWHDGENIHPLFESASRQTAAAREPQEEEDTEHARKDETPNLDRRDRISGVSDRPSFCKDIDRRIAEWKRGGASLSVLLVEVDEFLAIVEEYGDKAGEVVLRATAQFLKAMMRDTDHVARYDDSIFALLLPSTQVSDAHAVAERLRCAVERCTLPITGETVQFTVSLGAAEIAMNDETQVLLERAEAALTAAKDTGGNCCFAADEQLRPMALTS